ncbi:GGDEF domain-containing protein [Deinococcus depolymerans]|uniref:GGDEF domain-containing protein n=1 Tax=Deinococcus depolymerans TaxID=392408 RepID=A0ABN1BIJ7_9DEIO
MKNRPSLPWLFAPLLVLAGVYTGLLAWGALTGVNLHLELLYGAVPVAAVLAVGQAWTQGRPQGHGGLNLSGGNVRRTPSVSFTRRDSAGLPTPRPAVPWARRPASRVRPEGTVLAPHSTEVRIIRTPIEWLTKPFNPSEARRSWAGSGRGVDRSVVFRSVNETNGIRISGRLGWALLSLLALAAAEVAYVLLFDLPGVDAPDVSFVDGLYYLYYLGLLGVLWMDRAAGSNPGTRLSRGVLGGWLLDSLITVVVVGEVSWVLAVSPLLQDSGASVVFKAVSASYVLLDLLLLAAGLLLLRRPLEPARLPLLLGLLVYVGADFAYLLLGEHYQPAGLLDALWTWGTVGQAAGVTLLSRPRQADRAGEDPLPGGWSDTLLRALPYGAVAMACALLVVRGGTGDLTGRGVTWFTVAVLLLVLLRQRQAFVETTRLNCQLTEQAAELRRSRDEMEHLATHDGLTGLLNRHGFYRLLREAAPDTELTILMIDLDGFKPVNDTFGHAAGDLVLREVSARLRVLAGPSFVPARLGGDEFALVSLCPQRLEAAAQRAARVVQRLGEPYDVPGGSARLGASVGVAAQVAQDGETLLQQADAALYRAKRAGGGRLEVAAVTARTPGWTPAG